MTAMGASAEMFAPGSAFRRWLASRLGAEGPLEIRELRRHTEGFSWQTFTFLVDWQPAGADSRRSLGLAVRREPEDGLLSPYDIEGQYALHEVLAREADGVPVAPLRWLETDPSILGMPFYVMDRVDGPVPVQWAPDDPVVFPDAEARRRLGLDFVDILASIHRVPHHHLDVPRASSERTAGELAVRRWMDDYRKARLAPIPLVEVAAAWALDQDPKTDSLVLCHGDYRIGNFIVDPEASRIRCILDWELAEISDPVSDIAWAALPLFRGRSPLWSHLLEEQQFLERYADRTGLMVTRASLQYWTVVNYLKVVSSYLRAARAHREGRTKDLRLAAMGHQIVYVVRLLRAALTEVGAL